MRQRSTAISIGNMIGLKGYYLFEVEESCGPCDDRECGGNSAGKEIRVFFVKFGISEIVRESLSRSGKRTANDWAKKTSVGNCPQGRVLNMPKCASGRPSDRHVSKGLRNIRTICELSHHTFYHSNVTIQCAIETSAIDNPVSKN